MNKMLKCTCGCTEHITTIVPFLTGYCPETVDVDYVDANICAGCGEEAYIINCIDDNDDDLPF